MSSEGERGRCATCNGVGWVVGPRYLSDFESPKQMSCPDCTPPPQPSEQEKCENCARLERERDAANERLERVKEALRKYHVWLERVEQENLKLSPPRKRVYFGLDHAIGENTEGCDGCAALADAEEGEDE